MPNFEFLVNIMQNFLFVCFWCQRSKEKKIFFKKIFRPIYVVFFSSRSVFYFFNTKILCLLKINKIKTKSFVKMKGKYLGIPCIFFFVIMRNRKLVIIFLHVMDKVWNKKILVDIFFFLSKNNDDDYDEDDCENFV